MSNAINRLVRLSTIIGPNGLVPVSRSTWYSGIKAGRYPAPIKVGPRISAWRSSDIEKLIANFPGKEAK